MNNPFLNPAFSMASLTSAINILPNRYGRLEQLGLFPPKPVRTRQIVVEEYAGRLNLLQTKPPGSPGTVGERGKRKLRSFITTGTSVGHVIQMFHSRIVAIQEDSWSPSPPLKRGRSGWLVTHEKFDLEQIDFRRQFGNQLARLDVQDVLSFVELVRLQGDGVLLERSADD